MTILQAIILGIVQGATEFLPISSSGHLVLVPELLNWELREDVTFVFDVLVQWGTLFAVFIYYWKDLTEITKATIQGVLNRKPFETFYARLGWLLVLATIPAVILGLLLKDTVEAAFKTATPTAYFLLLTAALLIFAERVGKRTRTVEDITWKDALIIGFFQVMALFPGVSRSGSTIAGAMTRDLERPAAARFSFLMSVPVILGAGIVSTFDLLATPDIGSFIVPLLVATAVSAVVGYIAIRWLIAFLSKYPLYGFAVYVLFASIVLFLSI
jgi:undecaprenyl-diphosphatase